MQKWRNMSRNWNKSTSQNNIGHRQHNSNITSTQEQINNSI